VQIEKAYDAEIRQVEARHQQHALEYEEKIKRVYKDKFEDEAALKFEIQQLKG